MARKPRASGQSDGETEGAVAKRGPGRPPARPDVVVRCLINNLWTTRGKVLRGEEITIPATEADGYDAADKVKIVRDNA